MAHRAADPLGTLRRWWWLMLLVTVAGVAAAGGWLQLQEPRWVSTTSVLVRPAGHDTNVVGGRTQGEVNLDTEAQLVRSTALAAEAAELLGLETPPEELAGRVSVEVPANTSIMTIAYTGVSPVDAQAGARAFAEAYLRHRERTARADLSGQMEAIEARLDELDDMLTELNQQLAAAPESTAAAVNLESERDTATSQVNAMADRLNELATAAATVSAGEVISGAQLPQEPVHPRPGLTLASGAALGLMVGVVAGWLVERLARRVRRPADLTDRLGVPVLATFPRAAALRPDEIASPYRPAGRVIDRLRNEVIVSEPRVRDGEDPAGLALVVTGPTGGPAIGLVAANLAASLSRCGHEVILVAAGAPGSAGPLTRLLGLTAAPGLSEVLARRVSVAEALQRPPRHPRLRAMTMGSTATATGLLQSPALRTVLAALTAQAQYVVVEAPGTGGSADAQSLAGHADLTLLVVEARRTRLGEVADALDQLHRIGRPPMGAVLVPAQPAPPASEPPPINAGTRPAPRPASGEDRARLPVEAQTLMIGQVSPLRLASSAEVAEQPAGSEPLPEGERR